MEKSGSRKVLICNDTKFFELFHEFLCHTLEELGCETEISRTWESFMEELENRSGEYTMALIDPQITGFDVSKLKSSLSNLEKDLPSIGIRQHPGASISNVVKELGMEATICKTYPPQDMAFVFNRLLYPEQTEKRANPRALSALNVEYRMSNYQDWFFEDTFNVSTGGMFLRSYRENEEGADIRMKIYLPDEGQPLECQGKIVHMRPHNHSETSVLPSGMGVQFTSIDSDDAERLENHVRSRLLPIDKKDE